MHPEQLHLTSFRKQIFKSDDNLRNDHISLKPFPKRGEQVESENNAFENQHYLFNGKCKHRKLDSAAKRIRKWEGRHADIEIKSRKC